MSEVGDFISSSNSNSSSDWTLKDSRTGRTKTYTEEPSEDDIKCFNRELGYSTSKIITKDEHAKLVVVRPVDKSG